MLTWQSCCSLLGAEIIGVYCHTWLLISVQILGSGDCLRSPPSHPAGLITQGEAQHVVPVQPPTPQSPYPAQVDRVLPCWPRGCSDNGLLCTKHIPVQQGHWMAPPLPANLSTLETKSNAISPVENPLHSPLTEWGHVVQAPPLWSLVISPPLPGLALNYIPLDYMPVYP